MQVNTMNTKTISGLIQKSALNCSKLMRIRFLSHVRKKMLLKILCLSSWIFLPPAHPLESTNTIIEEKLVHSGMLHPVSNKKILEVFFRALIEESQGGYVLYGSKPICIEGILPDEINLMMLGDDFHRRHTIFKQGLKIWQKLPCKNQEYLIHFSEKSSHRWQHLTLINREEFIKTVKENLPLFQYVLGLQVSPEGLFAKLIDPNESLLSIFYDDDVLTGIVMGFGTQNALNHRREYKIESVFSRKEKPPFSPLACTLKKSVKSEDYTSGANEAIPSFGYSSLSKERDHLSKITFISKDLVAKSLPTIPWFGCLKSQETQKLLQGYCKTQKKIQKLPAGDRFLETILTRFGVIEVSKTLRTLAATKQDLGLKEDLDLSTLIAQSIHADIAERKSAWIASFIRGMQANEAPLSIREWYALLDNHQEAKQLLESKQNLIQCEQFFTELPGKKQMICLAPDMLYYKVTKAGKGKSITSPSCVVKMDYVIKDHTGTVLSAARACDEGATNLSDLIAGLSAAMQGMTINEEREIYIHPAFAYGESSNSPPNTGLIAHIKLHSIDSLETSDTIASEIPLTPLELTAVHIDESAIKEKCQTLECQVASQLGTRTWSHFKKGQEAGYSLDSVVQAMHQINQTDPVTTLSPEADELLSRLHWRIYMTSRYTSPSPKIGT